MSDQKCLSPGRKFTWHAYRGGEEKERKKTERERERKSRKETVMK